MRQTGYLRILVVMTMVMLLSCQRAVEGETDFILSVGQLSLRAPDPISPKNGRIISSTDRVTLRWRLVANARSYLVQVSQDSLFSTVFFSNHVDTTFAVTASLPERVYFWRVRAQNGPELISPWSEVWRFKRASEF